jgi:protein involved in polysaccharide export with SLBB domain
MKTPRFVVLSGLAIAVVLGNLPTLAQIGQGGGSTGGSGQTGPTKNQGGGAGNQGNQSGPGRTDDKDKDRRNPPDEDRVQDEDLTKRIPGGKNQKGNENGTSGLAVRKVRQIGPNSTVPSDYKPVVFESGPFEGLEAFGYNYFAAARESVKQRAKKASQPQNQFPTPPPLGTNPDRVNALDTIVGPAQMTFQDVNMPAPDRYQLGPGDKLSVRFSSPTEEAVDRTLVVDGNGSITVPVMGTKLTVRGMTLAQAQSALEKEIRRALKGAQVTLNLSELRSISVSVVGEVVSQGNYQFPSVMTLFNALFASGGPTMNGSMRKIQLRRSNGKSYTVDLYSYLIKGDDSQDIPLQPGDLILVPIATNRVAVRGEVGRPGVYEVTEKESLKDILEYAGGAKASAVTDQIEISSYQPGVQRQIVNINIANASTYKLKTDDVVTFYTVRDEFQNTVEVEGAVDQPRKYQLSVNMTVADAIMQARGVLSEAYTQRADLYRQNPDKSFTLIPIDLMKALERDPSANLVLQRHDRIKIYSQKEVNWLDNKTVTLTGAVRNPGKYVRMDGMKVRDLLLQGGGLAPEASYETIFVYRKNRDGSEGPLLQLDARGLLAGQGDVVLNDLDEVVVYTVSESKFQPRRTVIINGAVQRPGTYPRSENLMLTDLIKISGGLIPSVGTTVQISHSRVPEFTDVETYQIADLAKGILDIPLKDGDVVTIPARGDYQEQPILVEVRGRVVRPGVYAVKSRSEKLSTVIEQAGGLTPDAWATGAQFLRDPINLKSEAEERLSPRLKSVFESIHETQYMRALAKSDLDKIRIINLQGGNQAMAGLSLLAGLSAPVQIPANPLDTEAAKKLISARDLVSPARVLKEEELDESGNIPIRLDMALADLKSPHNIFLRDHDIIIVPERPTTIAVRGALFVPSTILYEGVKPLQYYLDRCGGPTIDADRDQIIVIRATGTITKARPSTKIELGDTIFVPTKVMIAQLQDGQSNLENIFKQITNLGFMYALFRAISK